MDPPRASSPATSTLTSSPRLGERDGPFLAHGRIAFVAAGECREARIVEPAERPHRGAAVWALGRLDRDRLAALAGRDERDATVREEWSITLGNAPRR